MKNTSRRQFLKAAAVTTGGVLAARSLPSWALRGAEVSITPPLSVFQYSQVQLLDSLFLQQFEHNHKIFLDLDEDGLLKPFRQRQGMPAPGPDMGGWYDNSKDFDPPNGSFHGFIPGHSFGQYVSGLSRAYAVTGSKATQAKVQRLVRGYGETVD
ncbi:MAG: beta-L-arabinofuranosidase domain-containing protein, partial [Candidatus Sulfotelmatobacter sp.]